MSGFRFSAEDEDGFREFHFFQDGRTATEVWKRVRTDKEGSWSVRLNAAGEIEFWVGEERVA